MRQDLIRAGARCLLGAWLLAGLAVPAAQAGPTLTAGGAVDDAADSTSADDGTWMVYRVDDADSSATGTVGEAAQGVWAGEIGAHLDGLTVGSELVAIIERAVNPGSMTRAGYYAVMDHVLTNRDPAEFDATTLRAIPVPAVSLDPGYTAHLSWGQAVEDSATSNIVGYHVYRSPDGINFTRITTTTVTGTSYTDNGFPADTSYYALGLVYRGTPEVAGTVISANSARMTDSDGDGAVDPPEPEGATDAFADAPELSGSSGTLETSNVGATAETGEPSHGAWGTPAASVWVKWTAPSGLDQISFDTHGSSYDTALAVYTGTSVDNLNQIDSNDIDPLSGCCTSRVTFVPEEGQIYHIAVDGYGGATGEIVLNWGPLETNVISGTVSLPGTDTAPSGGLSISIEVYNEETSSYVSDINAHISAGESDTTYEIEVSDDEFAQWRVSYWCWDCGYVSQGHYAEAGTTPDSGNASLLTGGTDHSDINLELLEGNLIQGTVSLPSGDVAPEGGLFIDIYARNQNSPPYYWADTFVNIPEGQSAVAYELVVPIDASAQWRVRYSCWSCGYWNEGYYSSTGTTANPNESTQLTGDQDHDNIDLLFLEANVITGTVSLPGADVAPADGLNIEVDIQNHDGPPYYYSNASVAIPEAQSSSDYEAVVPAEVVAQWRVEYWCHGCGYLSSGYYAHTGTTPDIENATLLSSGADYSGIDLQLLDENELDSDGDGMPDVWEIEHGLDPYDPSDANEDPDGDGLTNLEEYEAGTDPNNPDTDGDGIADGLDDDPTVSSNLCNSNWPDVDFANTYISAGQVGTCAAANSVSVQPTLEIEAGGTAKVISPNTYLQPGFSVPIGAELEVMSADPLP